MEQPEAWKKIARWTLAAVAVGLLLYIVFTAGGMYRSISTLRSEAKKLYPPLLTFAYEQAKRQDYAPLRSDRMFSHASVAALEKLDGKYGPVEEYQLDYMEPDISGVHHLFSVRVKRKGVWRDEDWNASRLEGLTSMVRDDRPLRLKDLMK